MTYSHEAEVRTGLLAQPIDVQPQGVSRPEAKKLHYNKGRIARYIAVVLAAGGILTYETQKGIQQSAHIHEAAQLAQPAGEVAAQLATGEINPNSIVAISAPTSDTGSGEASDLVRLGWVPSSARDEVAGIIGGQVGSPAKGTGIVLPKGDVNLNALPKQPQ